MTARTLAGGLACALAFVLACVYPEYQKASEAKAEYTKCIEEHSASHSECQALWESYQSELVRYEENARLRWSCDPAQDECPTKR